MGNPARGCGSKQPDSYYLEGEEPGSDSGMFWSWTWFLGDGIEDFLIEKIPPRSVILANPAATIIEKSLVRGDYPYQPPEDKLGFYSMLASVQTADMSSADHVGKNNYTAWSFANEVNRLGPSRKVTKKMAKVFAEIFQKRGPFPMLFSHSQVPVFQNEEQRNTAVRLANQSFNYLPVLWSLEDDLKMRSNSRLCEWLSPCWEHPNWGQYSFRNQSPGWQHCIVPVLIVLDHLSKNKRELLSGKDEEKNHWARVEREYSELRFTEQIYGASFMTKVTYTLPKEDKEAAAEKAMQEIPGVDILDLDLVETEMEKEG